MVAMLNRSGNSGASLILVVVGLALLLAASAWVLWPEGPGPLTNGQEISADGTLLDQHELAELDRTQPVTQVRRDSPLVQANIAVLLALPAWAEMPETVRVELIPQGSNPADKRHLWTKNGGKFVQFDDVMFGSWLVRCAPRGFQATEVPLSVSEAAPNPRQVLNLKPARAIRGRVLDSTGVTVAGVPVSARPVEAIVGFTVTRATTTTDEEGRYRLSSLPEGKYWVFAGELRSPIGPMVEIDLLGDEAWADLTIPRLGSAEVTALDSQTQQPISGMRVQAERITHAEEGVAGHVTFKQTGDDGIAHFTALPPGEYAFTFLLPSGYKTKTQRFEVSEGQKAEFSASVLPLR